MVIPTRTPRDWSPTVREDFSGPGTSRERPVGRAASTLGWSSAIPWRPGPLTGHTLSRVLAAAAEVAPPEGDLHRLGDTARVTVERVNPPIRPRPVPAARPDRGAVARGVRPVRGRALRGTDGDAGTPE